MKLSVSMTDRECTLGWCYLAIELVALPGILQTLGFWFNLGNTALNLLGFFLNFAFVAVIFHRFLWKNLQMIPKKPLLFAGVCIIMFAVYQGASLSLNQLIARLFPDFSNANNANIGQMVESHYLPMFIGTVLLVPVAEETLFRGLVFGRLLPKSPVAAWCASTLGFALAHVMGYVGQLSALHFILSIIQYLPAGVCLCYAYEKADSIWAPIFIHIAVNLTGMLAMR